MNNQKLQESQREANVGKRRRFLQKVGIVTPVILTLSSPSVFGGNAMCMSQQMSGAVSNPGVMGCNIGTYNPSGIVPPNFPTGTRLSESTVFKDEFGGTNASTFGAILTADSRSREATYITALVNAQTANYVLDESQVKLLFAGGDIPDGYSDDEEFLLSTFP